jgi:small GTP-binding protein
MGLQGKVRVALVGDAGCGKTALTVKFTQNLFIDYHCPTESVEDFSGEIDTRKGLCCLTVLDTSSSNEAVRALSYVCSNVVVVCFDLTRTETLESVESRWIPELNKHCPGVPFIIAGCKRDEMCDGPDGCVCEYGTCCDLGEEELTALLSRTGASAYIDCSALTDENVEPVFGVAAECVNPKRRNSAKRLVASIKKKLSRL